MTFYNTLSMAIMLSGGGGSGSGSNRNACCMRYTLYNWNNDKKSTKYTKKNCPKIKQTV